MPSFEAAVAAVAAAADDDAAAAALDGFYDVVRRFGGNGLPGRSFR